MFKQKEWWRAVCLVTVLFTLLPTTAIAQTTDITLTRICPIGDDYGKALQQCLDKMVSEEEKKYATFLDHQKVKDGAYSRETNKYEGALVSVKGFHPRRIETSRGTMLELTATIGTSSTPVQEIAQLRRELDSAQAKLAIRQTRQPTTQVTLTDEFLDGPRKLGVKTDGLVAMYLETYFYEAVRTGQVLLELESSEDVGDDRRKVTFSVMWGLTPPSGAEQGREYHLNTELYYFDTLTPGGMAYYKHIRIVKKEGLSIAHDIIFNYSPMVCIHDETPENSHEWYEAHKKALELTEKHPAFVRVEFGGEWAELPLFVEKEKIRLSPHASTNFKPGRMYRLCLITHSWWYQKLFKRLSQQGIEVSFVVDKTKGESHKAVAKLIIK